MSAIALADRCACPRGYPTRLALTGMNYYDSKNRISNMGMTSASDELAIQLEYEEDGKDSRWAKEFDDIFARNNSHRYVWQWTDTFLRVPDGKSNPDKHDYTDSHGRKYWAREFGNGDEVVDIVYVPEGGIVPITKDIFDVWDTETGLPRITSDDKYGTFFWFNPNPGKDDVSGHNDVAVGRRCYWSGEHERISLDAFYERWLTGRVFGVRPVIYSHAKE